LKRSSLRLIAVLATAFVAVSIGLNSSLLISTLGTDVIELRFSDPEGDSDGTGDYYYRDAKDVYRPEYFDLLEFYVSVNSTEVVFAARFKELDNPLKAPLGFSPQVVHIYVVGGECAPRRVETLGLNVKLRAVDAWCYAVVIAPGLDYLRPQLVYANGTVAPIDAIHVENKTIYARIPRDLLQRVEADPSKWRYLVAVSAYDPNSPDGLVEISDEGGASPIVSRTADSITKGLLPRVLDILAESREDQYSMLRTYSREYGDIAVVAAYPYVEGYQLPAERTVVEILTYTVVNPVTETFVRVYPLPNMTITVVESVQVPKYGIELYALATLSVALTVVLALVLRKGFLSKSNLSRLRVAPTT
jgi:carbohydrate-binding DOMON domain-containing protein